jgi:hypothetical protein
MEIKRREFIRVAGSAALLAGLAPFHLQGRSVKVKGKGHEHFTLKGFDDEQEEYPSMVWDKEGEVWMFSLRRLSYPQNSELVSAFRFSAGEWVEEAPVTKKAGMYEAPTAACAPDGRPLVAWSFLDSGNWNIQVSDFEGKAFSRPRTFKPASGRYINPVLTAAEGGRAWLAWEKYDKGKLSICISARESGRWGDPVEYALEKESCFDPALAADDKGKLFMAYGLTDGYHQNIEMAILDGTSLRVRKTVPVATGGGFTNRINLNQKPALALDSTGRLWIAYENNRFAHRLEDSDCFTGDRHIAMVSYEDDQILEPAGRGKWLFSGKNDHKASFFKDREGQLYVASHCGGDFTGNPFWQNRLSMLETGMGWTSPVSVYQSKQKGVLIPPAFAFDQENHLWMATLDETEFEHDDPSAHDGVVHAKVTSLLVMPVDLPPSGQADESLEFIRTQVEEHRPGTDFIPEINGRPKVSGVTIESEDQEYTLVYGNLHEHSENSPCWPAGTDGTLHDDYRFALFTENYNFVSITDHGYSQTELYWRKNMRLADFYNDPPYFVAIPGMEWTLSARGDLEKVYGAGHYNVIFATEEDVRKFIRNAREIYNVSSPETSDPKRLWNLLHEKEIDCITIPHHPASRSHPVDWHVHDPHFVPVVEMFQCRGNAEYPGCPRVINVQRHSPTESKRAFVDYALREMKYKMGFVASGDHNGLGVGTAALWVKELSREGLLEAMRERRCFATTGDKIIVDFRVNGKPGGSTVRSTESTELRFRVKGQRDLEKVEILRNSRVIKEYPAGEHEQALEATFRDSGQPEEEVLYYYVRATQKNGELAWSSPVWIEKDHA